ncbi:Hypothetical protein POVN_LOCUS356 [uncultured virus]|nr:Hypothetical protein POVN_LOCUS356 [uncultured virus]
MHSLTKIIAFCLITAAVAQSGEFTDEGALALEQQWKDAFPSASLLPVIGLPSNGNGVATLTHGMNDGMKMSINGLQCNSPLCNNALYSAEVADGHWLNLYEIMIPDIPGRNGEPSTGDIYVNLLQEMGLEVDGNHYHWKGAYVMPQATGILAVHHKGINIDPFEFSARTIRAIQEAADMIHARS